MTLGDRILQFGKTRTGALSAFGAFLVIGLVAVLIVRAAGGEGDDRPDPAAAKQDTGTTACAQAIPISVDADPAIADSLAAYVATERPDDAACVAPEINPAGPAEVIAKLSGGTDEAAPDLWIPDSQVWLSRVGDQVDTAEDAPSIATSPVVLAAAEAAVDADTGWTPLLTNPKALGTQPPAQSASTLIAVAGISALDFGDADPAEVVVTMAANEIEATTAPFAHVLGEAKPALSAIPASEQAVFQHAVNGDGGVAAVYPDQPTPWLDYPAVVLGDEDAADAARDFTDELLSPAAQDALTGDGFRSPQGELRGSLDGVGGDAGAPADPMSSDQAAELFERWAALTATSRAIVAVDVSGSMSAEVPETSSTRYEIALHAIAEGIPLFREDSELTLWEFSADDEGDKEPHRTIADWRTVREHVESGVEDIAKEVSPPDGGTPLYDTTLAAVLAAQEGWQPDVLNIVIMLTDGKNEFDDGLTRDQLVEQLAGVVDPDRRTPVLFVGFGTDVDPAELEDIARVTGGQVHLSPDVKDLRDVYLAALQGLTEQR